MPELFRSGMRKGVKAVRRKENCPPDPMGVGPGGYMATKPKVMGVFGLGRIELIPPNQKNGFWGVRGGGGAHFGRFFAHFWRHFFTVGLTKKFSKPKMSRRVILVYLGRRILTWHFYYSR